MSPFDPQTVYASTLGAENIRTNNGGQTWQKVGIPWAGHMTDVATGPDPDPDTERLYVSGGYDASLFISTDDGTTYHTVTLPIPDLYTGMALSATQIAPDLHNEGNLIIGVSIPFGSDHSTWRGGFYSSNDYGEHWQWIEVGHIINSVSSLVYDPSEPLVVYAGTEGGELLKSSDGGATWQTIWNGPLIITAIAVHPQNSRVIFVSGRVENNPGNGIWASTNGGGTWNYLTNQPTSGPVWALSFAQTNPPTLYAGTMAVGLWRSTDNGQNWTVANGLDQGNVRSIATMIDGERVIVYVGVSGGVITIPAMDNSSNVPQAAAETTLLGSGVYRYVQVSPIVPTVLSITCASSNPTNASSVDFGVAFSEVVTGVDIADFKLTNTILTGASVTDITGTGAGPYTVTVNTGSGNGTIHLDIRNTASIQDSDGNAFAGPYTGGETYTISKGTAPTVPVLKLPANNALVTSTPTLDWSDSSEVMALANPWSYEVNVVALDGYNHTFNTASGLSNSSLSDWSAAPLSPNTTYTWKVRAYNDQNQYSGWSAPFTFRTKLETPVLISPADAVSPALDNKRPTFTWDVVPGAATYTLQILKGTAVVNTGTITAPAHVYTPAVDLLPDTPYSWKVKANGTNAGDYSALFTFTTSPNPPKVPVLTSPANALLVDGAVPQTLKWSPVLAVSTTSPLTTYPAAASFEVEYATNSAFTGSVVNTVNGNTLAETQLSLAAGTLLPNRTYYWHVRSWSDTGAAGNHSVWSAARTFRTKPLTSPLAPPTLISPTNAVSPALNNKRPTFTWDEVTGASSYTLQILKGAVVVNTGAIAVPLHTYTPATDLLAGTTYTWKVRANGLIASDYSAPFTFTTAPNPPKSPVLTLPVSAALVDSAAVQTLKWGAVPAVVTTNPATSYPAAASYEVEYATNSAFTGAIVTTVTEPQLLITIGALSPNRTYYWHVRAVSATGSRSTWSAARTFRTKLETPVLNLPENNAVLDSKRPTFAWDEVPGAISYTLQILKRTTVVNTGTILIPAYVYTPTVDLLPSTTYTWKVKANGVNVGDYSAPFTFTTSANPPKSPVQSLPKSGILIGSGEDTTLTWLAPAVVVNANPALAYPAASSYDVQVSTNSGFANLSPSNNVKTLNVTGTNTTLSAVLATGTAPDNVIRPGRTYYWRVRSLSAAGNYSAWSVSRLINVKFVAPALMSPASGATGISVRPTFTWDSNGNGLWTNFTLQVATNPQFTTGLRSFTINAPATQYTIPATMPALKGSTTYCWRVKINGLYFPANSSGQCFTTVP